MEFNEKNRLARHSEPNPLSAELEFDYHNGSNLVENVSRVLPFRKDQGMT